MNKIGSIPDFTDEETPSPSEFGQEVSLSSNEQATEPEVVEEKEIPSEPPAEQKPDEVIEPVEDVGVKKEELSRQIKGLQEERRKLILDLTDLRGERKQSKQAEIEHIQEKIDDLKDLNPEDVNTIDRIMKAKGYVSQESINQMFYNNRKQEEINNFLGEFPEYNDKNDPDGSKFGPLLNHIRMYYKEPQEPKLFRDMLRMAHKAINGTPATNERPAAVRQRQIQIAGTGAGGSQRSSSAKPFNDKKRQALLDGGWSEEDVSRMEQRQ